MNLFPFCLIVLAVASSIPHGLGLCRPHLTKFNFDLERFLGPWNILETGFTGVPPPSGQVEECVVYTFTQTESPEILGYGYQHKVNGSWLVTNSGYGIVMDKEMPSIYDIRANNGSYITAVLHTDYDNLLLLSACRDNEEQFYIGSRGTSLDEVPMKILRDLMAGFGNLTESRPIFHEGEGVDCVPPTQLHNKNKNI